MGEFLCCVVKFSCIYFLLAVEDDLENNLFRGNEDFQKSHFQQSRKQQFFFLIFVSNSLTMPIPRIVYRPIRNRLLSDAVSALCASTKLNIHCSPISLAAKSIFPFQIPSLLFPTMLGDLGA